MLKPISILIPYKMKENELYLWNQNRINSDYLEFPGGKIEINESPEDACLREIYEEVDVKLKDSDLEFFKTFSFNKDTKKLLVINVFLYKDVLTKFSDKGWYKAKELYELNIMPNNKIILRELDKYFQ